MGNKQAFNDKTKRDADFVKQEKREQKEMLHMQKQQEYLKNSSLRQMIKNQQKEAQERKVRDYEEKQMKARQ